MSRTRLIRPEFFTDETMASASIAARFVYIGLWTLCDDAGYFERKPKQIAAALFPYEAPVKRQRAVDAALADLEQLGRIRYLDCGAHGVVPTLPRHGIKGGSKAETYKVRHTLGCSVRTPDGHVRTSPDKSSSVSVSVSGSVSVMDRVEGRETATNDEPSAFRQLVPFPSGGKLA